MSPGIGSEGQFDPIGVVGVGVVRVGVVVSPSMAGVELSARRVEELTSTYCKYGGGFYCFKRRNGRTKTLKKATKKHVEPLKER